MGKKDKTAVPVTVSPAKEKVLKYNQEE